MQTVFGLSAIGIASWALRLWLVLLDCLPMVFKVMHSLRDKRPYDMLIAEHEEKAQLQAQARIDVARAHQRVVSASASEAARSAVQDAGGIWIDSGAGRILVGPNGSVFIPREFLTAMAPNDVGEWVDGLQVDLTADVANVGQGYGAPWPRRTHDAGSTGANRRRSRSAAGHE